jgi:hypothetical protein
VRDAIDNGIRQRLLAERYFEPFWRGEDVAKRFDTISENLRRALSDPGLDPRLAGRSLSEHLQRRYAAKERVE